MRAGNSGSGGLVAAGSPDAMVQLTPGLEHFCEPSTAAGLLLMARACASQGSAADNSTLGLGQRLQWRLLNSRCGGDQSGWGAAVWQHTGDWRRGALLAACNHRALVLGASPALVLEQASTASPAAAAAAAGGGVLDLGLTMLQAQLRGEGTRRLEPSAACDAVAAIADVAREVLGPASPTHTSIVLQVRGIGIGAAYPAPAALHYRHRALHFQHRPARSGLLI
jgi:hypothetical protein